MILIIKKGNQTGEPIMKKIITILLAAAMILSLAACGSSNSSSAASAAKSEASKAASEAKSEAAAASSAKSETAKTAETKSEAPSDAGFSTITDGVLTMGTNAAFPPYEYYEEQKIVGIDAEIAGAIAEKLGLTLEIVDMDFGSIITSVQTGKIDIGAAGMTVTEERLQNVNFTDTYSTGVQVVIVKEDSDVVKSLDDLDGALIGCQEATTGYIYCCDDYGEDNVIAYTNGPTAVKALVDGKVDCVVIDKQPALAFVAANEGLAILDTEYVVEDYAIAVSKDNEPLLDAINAVLKEMIADGTVQAILDKYISE